MNKVEKVISFFKKNPKYLVDCGIFSTRNTGGDSMETIYSEDNVVVDYCYEYDYLEIFGLSPDEFEEVATTLEEMANERRFDPTDDEDEYDD